MDVKNYYYNGFKEDLHLFLGNRKPFHEDEKVYDAAIVHSNRNYEVIPLERRDMFIYLLAYTVLIDMVIYAGFSDEYMAFKKFTQYPKFEYGLTNCFVYPWEIARLGRNMRLFIEVSEFFLVDLFETFKDENAFQISWSRLKNRMLRDSDLTEGVFGRVFTKTLLLKVDDGEKIKIHEAVSDYCNVMPKDKIEKYLHSMIDDTDSKGMRFPDIWGDFLKYYIRINADIFSR